MPDKKKTSKKRRSALATRLASQKMGFAGTIVRGSKASSFKKGTPNIHTVKPPQYSTTASAAAVSMSTSELLARQQRQRQQNVANAHNMHDSSDAEAALCAPCRANDSDRTAPPLATAAASTSKSSQSNGSALLTERAGSSPNVPKAPNRGLGGAMIIGTAPKITSKKDERRNNKRGKRKGKGKFSRVPDFMSPEKGVLILGTLRPADGDVDRFLPLSSSPARSGLPNYASVQHRVPSRRVSSAGAGKRSKTKSDLVRKESGKSGDPLGGGFGSSSSTGRLAGSKTIETHRRIVRRMPRNTSNRLQPPRTHMLTSPRVSHQEDPELPGSPPANELVLSWQPLGSPVRRMKRAMRFVQQNTCVTQRVTIDIGSVARLVIPCFEGITTISDLIETVRHRFPSFGITGLQQPLTATATKTVMSNSKLGTSRRAWNSVDELAAESDDSSNDDSGGNVEGVYVMELHPADFVSVAVSSDSALIAVGSNIPVYEMEKLPERAEGGSLDSDIKVDENKFHNSIASPAKACAPAKKCGDGSIHPSTSSPTTGLNTSSSSSFTRNVTYSAGTVPSTVKDKGYVPKTPLRKVRKGKSWIGDRKEAADRHEEQNVEPESECAVTQLEPNLQTKGVPSLVSTGSPVLVLTSAREEPDILSAEGGDFDRYGETVRVHDTTNPGTSMAVGDGVGRGLYDGEMSSSKPVSKQKEELEGDMASVVRNRLMHRIRALAEKGAISPSQRGYLNNLISVRKIPAPSSLDATPPTNTLEAGESTNTKSNMGGRTRHHPHRTLTPTDQDASHFSGVPAPPLNL